MEFILTTIIVIYVVSKLLKFLFKFFIARKFSQFTGGGSWEDFVKGAQNGQASGGSTSKRGGSAPDKKEGDVTVTTVADHHKKVSDKVGDYVDFEDVK